MKKTLIIAALCALSALTSAQVRPTENEPQRTAAPTVQLPANIVAKYEGGMHGYGKKMEGTLRFDDENARLVFFGENQKELFQIPYASLLVIYPQSRSVTSTTGNVVRHIPLPGSVLGGFMKEKRRYLIIQFDDPDIDLKGVVNFKLQDKETLDAVLATLADKARLQQRGDAYYRPKTVKSGT